MKSILGKIFRRGKDNEEITIVSGLPRSGTSMMMRMLEAGGMAVVTDNTRKPDVDNPKGYYEFEKVKKIKDDSSWLDSCRGMTFKMVSELLYNLPNNEKYKVVFMRRDMDEMLASQQKMLERLNQKGADVSNDKMKVIYGKHLKKIKQWLEEQEHIDVFYIYFSDVIQNPIENAMKLNDFLGGNLNVEKMSGVVEKALYRQRK